MMLEKKSCDKLFDDFLGKPFHLHELRRIVDKYIEITPDTGCSTAGENKEAALDTDQIIQGWNQELDQLYREAEMSGSLDAAAELGGAMQKKGVEENLLSLIEMGKKLQSFALDLDIQGVDHNLSILKSIAREGQ
jgi:hypothetical protein